MKTQETLEKLLTPAEVASTPAVIEAYLGDSTIMGDVATEIRTEVTL